MLLCKSKLSRAIYFCLALLTSLSAPAIAQKFPNGPIRIITPVASGGTADILGRLVGTRLSEKLKTPVLIESRASATGVLAGEVVANANPDGHTLLLAYQQHTVGSALGIPMTYHPINSFTPISQMTAQGLLLVVNPRIPTKTLREFLEWTRTAKNLNFGSAGIGSGGHLAGELYNMMTGAKAQHIPYKGTGPSLADLMAGQYEYSFNGLQASISLANAGKLRALAVTTPKRLDSLPDLPAISELLPGFEVVGWFGLLAPANLPATLTSLLGEEVIRTLGEDDIRSKIKASGAEPVGSVPEEFRRFLIADLAKWTRVVKERNLKPE